MHSLVLVNWLALASPVAAEPVTLQVETHSLASPVSVKASASGESLVGEATHAMSAHMDARGQIEYHCENSAHRHHSDSSVRAAHEEH